MAYDKNKWVDHIEDIETGEVIQMGTLYCARLMNNMEDGIYNAHLNIDEALANIENLTTKVITLEKSLVNNMQFNNFIEDFSNLDDVIIIDGIYNKSLGRIIL